MEKVGGQKAWGCRDTETKKGRKSCLFLLFLNFEGFFVYPRYKSFANMFFQSVAYLFILLLKSTF